MCSPEIYTSLPVSINALIRYFRYFTEMQVFTSLVCRMGLSSFGGDLPASALCASATGAFSPVAATGQSRIWFDVEPHLQQPPEPCCWLLYRFGRLNSCDRNPPLLDRKTLFGELASLLLDFFLQCFHRRLGLQFCDFSDSSRFSFSVLS